MKYSRFALLVVALLGPGVLALSGSDRSTAIVQSLGHVGLAVSDLARALHFYTDQLG